MANLHKPHAIRLVSRESLHTNRMFLHIPALSVGRDSEACTLTSQPTSSAYPPSCTVHAKDAETKFYISTLPVSAESTSGYVRAPLSTTPGKYWRSMYSNYYLFGLGAVLLCRECRRISRYIHHPNDTIYVLCYCYHITPIEGEVVPKWHT